MKLVYALAIVLSAVLLFSVEPMITHAMLPLLGGSSAVWITALAFFQLALLLGYAYAAFIAPLSATRPRLSVVHLVLLGLAAASLLLPGWPRLGANTSANPQLHLFALLAQSIGLPFVALSTSAPLLQTWYARREQQPVPYRLFGLSNLASLAALLAYPTLIEPHLDLTHQGFVWRAGFVLYVALAAYLTLRAHSAPASLKLPVTLTAVPAIPRPSRVRLLWFALPAVASMQLAAVTSHLTQDVASMPLLWVVPLAAYLLSFVLAFQFPALFRRSIVLRLLAVLLFSLGYFLSQTEVNVPIQLNLFFYLAELLIACWFLHAELFALRPQHSTETSAFYLYIAAGGAAGTVVVAILTPLLTDSNYDLPLSFLFTAAVTIAVVWPAGMALRLFWAAATALGCALLYILHGSYTHDAILRARNFYGSVRVKQTQYPPQAVTSRILLNGAIQHGMQWFSADFRHTPLTYYAPDSGVGLAFQLCCDTRPRHIGVIGLGAGTVAAYAHAGDSLCFYEINPLVIGIAQNLFTYTRDTAAATSIVPGDARLSLAAEPAQGFDVLVVDAFSGDSIPVHLLTEQALELYRRHLAPGGVLAFHISNQFLDFAPVLARLVENANAGNAHPLFAGEIDTSRNDDRGEFTASWVLVTERSDLFQAPALASVAHPIATRPGVALWTDQYSSLLPVLRWSGMRLPAR